MTIHEIALRLSLPESSVRFYRDKFPEFVPSTGTGKRRRYLPEAVTALGMIADMMREGVDEATIRARLAETVPIEGIARPQSAAAAAAEPQAIIAEPQQDAAAIRALLADMVREAVADGNNGLMAEVIALREEVQRLTAALTAMQQQQQQPTAEPQPTATESQEPPALPTPRRWRWPWERRTQ